MRPCRSGARAATAAHSTRSRRGWWVAILLLLSAPVLAGTVSGVVFEDINGNGVQEGHEAGIAGIAISNGRDIVRSDNDGRYAIAAAADDVVFAIKPPSRAFNRRDDGLPAFWRLAGDGGGFDIALSPPQVDPGELQVLLFTDPQVASLAEVGYYRTDIVEPLQGTGAALGLTLGDIVADDLSLYPAVNAVTASLGVPWLHVAGNHDRDGRAPGDAGSLATFQRTYGPDTVAWEEPRATFIGLDDVIAVPGQRPAYVGGLRADQFAFLQAYLPTLPHDRLLVIGVHIPFFDTAAPGAAPTFRPADRERLFALLARFPHVLLLSGHTHTQQHVFYGAADGWHGVDPLHEYNLGAACGAFWSGVRDEAGIPDATMADGTPNGYAVLVVGASGRYRLAWHGARDPLDVQIGVSAPRVLRQGAYPAWGVYANVYMGTDDSVVEYRVDGGEWMPMRKVLQPDPRLLAENVRDDLADHLRGYDRSPEATPSRHLWRGALPTGFAVGEHHVDVRHFDRWRGEQRAATTYSLESATP